MENDYVICLVCNKKVGVINHLHLKSHKMTTREYMEKFPNADVSSKSMLRKRSEKLKGKKRSDETRKKLSESNKKAWKNNPNIGRTGVPLSDESKKKLSNKMMGHFVSEETRKKIGQCGIGRVPWNKGMTKYDDDRIMGVSKKVKEWNKYFMNDEKRQQISQSLKKRYSEGMKIPNSKNGLRKDIGMSFRSIWEANYARILKFNEKEIIYEKDNFTLYEEDGTIANVYTPDFKVGDNTYVEIKGHADSLDEWMCSCKRCIRDRKKMKMMIDQYPSVNIMIIGRKEYKDICQKYNLLIDNWEFSKWDDIDYIWKKES